MGMDNAIIDTPLLGIHRLVCIAKRVNLYRLKTLALSSCNYALVGFYVWRETPVPVPLLGLQCLYMLQYISEIDIIFKSISRINFSFVARACKHIVVSNGTLRRS